MEAEPKTLWVFGVYAVHKLPRPWSLGPCPKLRKTKTAERFWFAQGIEAVSFFAAGKKDTSG
jgi:hypothetical protein